VDSRFGEPRQDRLDGLLAGVVEHDVRVIHLVVLDEQHVGG
jgi:hypothetical protein